MDWPVKASNARGIAFYESLGAERVVERLSYRLNEAALQRLAMNRPDCRRPSLSTDPPGSICP
jgi:ribosomal protein S18 acetylase RimI-like enzyme